jgi:6-phosphogluconolactonase (cycloisomerase 2 family)
MTQIKVDTIADAAGTGAADFADGITIAGGALSALNTAEYYSSASEPTSPKNGAIWWDTTNEKVMVYIAGEFKEVELGASAGGDWTVDLSNVTYDSVSFNADLQEINPRTFAFNADGTKMYIAGTDNDTVYQYSLTTGFDVSTGSYDSVSFSVASQESAPFAITFNTDGTKMYVLGDGNDTAYQYSLTTGFDVSTASYDNVSFNFTSQSTGPQSIVFNTDGTKMFMSGPNSDIVYQYSLSTAFDVSTASYNSVSFSLSSQDTLIRAVAFNSDGTKMYAAGQSNQAIFQYSLSTGFDVSTASYDSVSFSTSSQDTAPFDIRFSASGHKMYVIGIATEYIYQYSTGL